jgi:hypothetical protein
VGNAPEGSGVPVGTQYHWYILAHQNVTKLNANDYTTSLSGLKFKIAHKRAGTEKWSATEKTKRKRMIRFLQDVIAELEKGPQESDAEPEQPAQRPARRKPARKSPTRKAIEAKQHPRHESPATPPSMKKPVRRRRKTTTA